MFPASRGDRRGKTRYHPGQIHPPGGHALKIFRSFLLAGIALVPGVAFAQTETVLITARPPDPVGNDAFSVMRLDGVALRNQPGLDQALRQVPGLSLFRRNSSVSANPTTQGVSLRSIAPSGAGRTLVTLDGVPQNDPFGGWVIWSALPAEDIAAAEIVRGAGAGPYGAGALTGVIALSEHEGTGNGLVAATAEYGELNSTRMGAAGGVQVGRSSLFGSTSYQHSDGWIPVDKSQRGRADDEVTLDASTVSARYMTELFTGTVLSVRGSAYDEKRDAGIFGSKSHAKGVSGSITLAHPASPGELGWRLQGWVRNTDLVNVTYAVQGGLARTGTLPTNEQYATPAIGHGFNAALRGTTGMFDWEVGADARFAQGETREFATFAGGIFTRNRLAGGRTAVGGLYAEGAGRFDGWLLTAGVRVDHWASNDGHLRTYVVPSGAIFNDVDYANKSGTLPTFRVGARRDLGNGMFVRAAGYEGFRAPSLNELYRPFRLGNNITLANAALRPEKLYGAELGIGGDMGDFTWNGTLFWNRLEDAITNVTIGTGPLATEAGFAPAGGLVIQRQNAGYIDAIGVEGEARYRMNEMFALNGAFSYSSADVHGGTVAPQLNGKQPVQQPRLTLVGGLDVMPMNRLTLSGLIRYESERFADDLNTLSLGTAVTVDARATIRVSDNVSAYIAVDNLTDESIATTKGADGVVVYDAPRIFRVGLSFVQ